MLYDNDQCKGNKMISIEDANSPAAKRRECTICKHLGRPTVDPEKLERTSLYANNGSPVGVNLCRRHSVELFKLGQKNFLLRYYRILDEVVDSDEAKFIDILRDTVRRNASSLY